MKQFLSIILFFICLQSLHAQTNKDTTDAKVGLVLSGGGAKGLAHIGALKIIDSLGIRLDYIAGSSMGAIVGGLYASGYNAKQLDSLFHEVNFNDLIQDKIPRSSKTFYEKEYSEKYALTLPVVDNKIALPKSISNGQNFYNFYSSITTHVHHINDFSKLPTPFFCTGTNIETGKGVVFDKGYLPDVVAASSALPTVYSPVTYNNKLITDGGVTDNYPIEEIKKRGAEIVIGVDVQDTLLNKTQFKSVTDIMLQISNFRTINDMKTKAPLTDVYIKPNIKRFSVVGFGDGKEIIKEGEKSTRKQIPALKEILKKQHSKSIYKKGANPEKEIKIDDLQIENELNYSKRYAKSKLRIDTPSSVTIDRLTKGLDNLYTTGNFERIRYKIQKNSNGENILSVNLEESKTTSFFRFALHYDDLYKSAALINYTHKNLFTKNDVISTDLIVGDEIRYNLDYYIDKGSFWSVGLRHNLYQFERDLEIGSFDADYLDVTTQLYIETLLKHAFAFRIGLEHKYLQIATETLNENELGTAFEDVNYYSIYSSIKYDSFNDKYFPRRGVKFRAEFSGYPVSSLPINDFEEFAIAKSKISYAFPISHKVSGFVSAEGGVRLGKSTGVNSLDFFLGGYGSVEINNQVSFLGYDFLEITGDSYVKSTFNFDYEFHKKHHVNLTANFSNVGNRIFDLDQWFQLNGFSGYGIGYGYDSVIGPVQVKYAFSPDKNTTDQLFFSVGYWF